MPRGVFKISDIPKSKVAEIEAFYRLDNPTKLEKKAQANGLWTVIATFDGMPNSKKKFSALPGNDTTKIK
jgi:hypothetical protein